jgi:hypothetical protein
VGNTDRVPHQVQAGGRRWSIAAVALYLVILLFLLPTFGGSLVLVPVAMVLGVVAWRRDRPSRLQRSATRVTLALLPLVAALLVFHLIWGDLS